MRRTAVVAICCVSFAALVVGCSGTPAITEVASAGSSSTAATSGGVATSAQPVGTKAAMCAVARDKKSDLLAKGSYFDKFGPFYETLQSFERTAPTEIRDAVEGLVKDLTPLRDLEPEERSRAATAIRERDEFKNWLTRMVAYLEDECELDLTEPATGTTERPGTSTTTTKKSTDTTVSRLAQLREWLTTRYPDATWLAKINSHSVAVIGDVTSVTLGSADGPPFTVAEALEACEAASGWLFSDPARANGKVEVTEGELAGMKKVVTREGEAGSCKHV